MAACIPATDKVRVRSSVSAHMKEQKKGSAYDLSYKAKERVKVIKDGMMSVPKGFEKLINRK